MDPSPVLEMNGLSPWQESPFFEFRGTFSPSPHRLNAEVIYFGFTQPNHHSGGTAEQSPFPCSIPAAFWQADAASHGGGSPDSDPEAAG